MEEEQRREEEQKEKEEITKLRQEQVSVLTVKKDLLDVH